MDAIDRKIIDFLQQDGRLPHADLGAAIGLSASAVHERVKRLQAAGVLAIRGIAAPGALGLDVLAFTFVILDRPEHEAGFVAAMQAEPHVLECHHVTGEWSYLLKLCARSNADLERLIAGTVKRQPGVVRSLTAIALSSAKDATALPVGDIDA
jgi:Lrp/AsnC family leucine-responsive transcriptional regulator